jgi:uncharacterized protein (DUF1778 family)
MKQEKIEPFTIYLPESLKSMLKEAAEADKRPLSTFIVMVLSKCDKKALLKKITS